MARPRKKIDLELLKKLAAINCSYAEMASVLDCTEKTLSSRFYQVIKKGRAQGTMSLKRKQYELAMDGNVGMLVWLGKNLLGQTDKHDISIQALSDEQIAIEVTRRLALSGPTTEEDTSEVPRTETEVKCEVQS